jgi:hypothetical protein
MVPSRGSAWLGRGSARAQKFRNPWCLSKEIARYEGGTPEIGFLGADVAFGFIVRWRVGREFVALGLLGERHGLVAGLRMR